jgi:hypothetical protein
MFSLTPSSRRIFIISTGFAVSFLGSFECLLDIKELYRKSLPQFFNTHRYGQPNLILMRP